MRLKEYTLLENYKFGGVRTYHSSLLPQLRPYNVHHHTECEISVFLAGSGTYTICGRDYPFSKGDVFVFGSNEVHCLTEIIDSTVLTYAGAVRA